MTKPQIVVAVLSNSDAAVFVNGHRTFTRDATDVAQSAEEVGAALALALDSQSNIVQIDVHQLSKWTWDDMYKAALEDLGFLKPLLSSPGCSAVLVAAQEKYSAALSGPVDKDFTIELEDQREEAGNLRVGIAAVDGEIGEILDATLLVKCMPGSRHDSPALRLAFDDDNEAATIYRQNDRYVLCLGKQAVLRNTMLPGGSRGYLLDNY